VEAALLVVLAASLVLLSGTIWVRCGARGHLHDAADAPVIPVVIVFGAKLRPGGSEPLNALRHRLDTAASLVARGRATVVLVSGDAGGASGDETAAMTRYLVGAGVEQRRIVADPFGLDSYDTCRRARDVYGVRSALLVSQRFHLPRAVALCRSMGVDAEGVEASCDDCLRSTVVKSTVRDWFAAPKAAMDAWRRRPPVHESPYDPAVAEALRQAV
jgi:vancomycin permeability regulator SanA